MPKTKLKLDEFMILLIVAFIVMAFAVHNRGKELAKEDKEKITSLISDNQAFSITNGGIVDENKLKEIQNMDYNDIKKSLNAKNDFCIFIEDGNGNVIISKGSTKLSRDGIPCSG